MCNGNGDVPHQVRNNETGTDGYRKIGFGKQHNSRLHRSSLLGT